MDEYYPAENAMPVNVVRKRLRDYGAFQVDISQLATREVPVIGMRESRQTLHAELPVFSINNNKAGNQALSLKRQAGDVFYPGPAWGTFGGVSKNISFPTALSAQVNGRGTDIQQQSVVTTKKSARKKRVSFAIRLVLTLLLFSILFKSMSWSALLGSFTRISWSLVFVSLVVGAAGVVVSAYQWRSLLLGEKIHVDLAGLINLYMVGIGFSHFLPTGMGGDAVKALYVGRESSNHPGSVSAVLMCRVTGFIGMLLIAYTALIIWQGSFTTTIITSFSLLSLLVGGMIGGAVMSIGLLPRLLKGKWKNARIFTSVLQVGSALYISAKRPRSLLAAILYGVGFQAVAILNCYAYANAIGIQASLRFYCVAVPLIALVSFLPISINGYGLRESTYIYIFSTIHVQPAIALLLALMLDAQTLVFGVIGGCIYFRLSGQIKSKLEAQELKSRTEVHEIANQSAASQRWQRLEEHSG
ncbi:MAG: lysylphosphatidylglycerol synthase transmembrane domain-containing protein [Ktedonobacteraceae bacterium]